MAQKYLESGWSVIPIWGGLRPDRFKAAAISWKPYQTRFANHNELTYWFTERQFEGVAIVCGEVSRLGVMDFDDPAVFAKFRLDHPDLVQTYTVTSGGRGLPHLYFHVPDHLSTATRHASGVDWQFNGAYVVAPPTSTSDAAWQLQTSLPPKTLTEADLSRLMHFLDTTYQTTSQNAATGFSEPKLAVSHQSLSFDLQHLSRVYRDHLPEGRNNALFRTCCWLRDQGGTLEDALPLIELHAVQATPPDHPLETLEGRRQEAHKTIRSAFRRSARQPKKTSLAVIPNQLREQLLQAKLMPVLRVLEALTASEWQPGDIFTRETLLALTQSHGIGDWSVRKALSAKTPDEMAFFETVDPAVANAAIAAGNGGVKTPQLNAIELRGTKPTKNRPGRPAQFYRVPSLRSLCGRYGITHLAGDKLAGDVLGSVRDYRLALHKGLLARRPGQYDRGWLADRLGVSMRTIRRYNTDPAICVSPRYFEQRVFWKNLDHVIQRDSDHRLVSHYGVFLEDHNGKRYPPFLPIARYLLGKNYRVTFKQQLQNHYSLSAVNAPSEACRQPNLASLPKKSSQPEAVTPHDQQQPLSTQSPAPDYDHKLPSIYELAGVDPPTGLSEPVMSSVPDKRPMTPSGEAMAIRLYETLAGAMSAQRAADCVRQYGQFAVEDVLDTLARRGDRVHSPAGFVVNLLQTRYGHDINATVTMEGLFLALHTAEGQAGIRWEKAQALVEQYGTEAVNRVLRQMRAESDIRNPVGYVIHSLRRNHHPSQPTSVKTKKEATQRLFEAVRKYNPDRALSQTKARELVREYGIGAVMEALHILQSRQQVRNPAGFVITVLRSEAKRKHHARFYGP
jgi:hypothetical protein